MSDEDFQQTVLDYFGIAMQRHRDIMATIDDVKKGNDAIISALGALTTSVNGALADLAATGAAGHAAVLDGIVGDQNGVLDTVNKTNAEIMSAISAVHLPSPKV